MPEKREVVEKFQRGIVLAAGCLAVGSLVAEFGFYLSERQEFTVRTVNLIIVGLFLFETLLSFVSASSFRRAFLRALPLIVISALFGLQIVFVKLFISERPETAEHVLRFFRFSNLTRLYFVILQVYIVTVLLMQSRRLSRRLAYSRFRPAQVFIGAFVALIVIGTLLLELPKAMPEGKTLSIVDALFTSTSAVCVTGLTVVDTATDFSKTGQAIILLLIQIGGLGIMTFAASFALLMGRGLGIKEGVMMREVLNVEMVGEISHLVMAVLGVTLVIEGIGAVLLFLVFPEGGFSVAGRIFTATFHSVSGFCNAGFSVFSDSLESFRDRWDVNVVMAGLIVLGGLGFTVHRDLLRVARAGLKRGRKKRVRLRLQTKVVLYATGTLILSGAAAVYGLERGNVTFLQAMFQSVTARTAGFDTTPQASLDEGTHFLTTVLMFIGGGPASTAGGIKVTTLAIILATVWAMTRGRPVTELFRKSIPESTVRESIVVASLSVFAISLSLMLLLITESGAFRVLLFEVVSAFGTVGLSLGQTSKLTETGKIVVAATMLFGRVGPLAIALAVSGRLRGREYSYPTERMMVG